LFPKDRLRRGLRHAAFAAMGVVAAAVITMGVAAPINASPAEGEEPAPDYEFLVDTDAPGTPDANPGDNVCQTSAADGANCSLRAAIEEANAVSDPNATVRVGVVDGFEGTIVMVASKHAKQNMTTDKAAVFNGHGAYFRITRTMTVDLDNRIHTKTDGGGDSAGFWVDAPNVQLLNFTDTYSSETSIVFGPTADGSSLNGGSLMNTPDDHIQVAIRVRPGADNITISNYTMGRFPNVSYSGLIRLTPSEDFGPYKDDPIVNLTISGVTFDNEPNGTAGACSASKGFGGCADAGIVAYLSPILVNLVVENCVFKDFPEGANAIDLGGMAPSSTVTIRNNEFTRIATGEAGEDATIFLGEGKERTGVNWIEGNVFDNRNTSGQYYAIRWKGTVSSAAAASSPASNLTIRDNYFDGYGAQTILLNAAGSVTVRRNTFGPSTASQATTLLEETVGKTTGNDKNNKWGAMLMNYDNSVNRRILTWHPTKAEISPACELKVTVEPRAGETGYAVPRNPVEIDFYFTKGDDAEVFLGSVAGVRDKNTDGTSIAGPYVLKVPDLPPGAGFIRVQTQGPTDSTKRESSQYSRVVPVADPAGCNKPALSLDVQARTGVDPAASTYAQVMASGTALAEGGRVAAGEPVWVTYTVRNEGEPPLGHVVVRDGEENPVCVLSDIPPGGRDGCWRRLA
jgi:hypothetical protein